eukprot:1192869-Prorocentrum_minimum.AAC.4
MNELGCLRRRACGRPWSLWLCAVAMKLDGVRKDYRSAAYVVQWWTVLPFDDAVLTIPFANQFVTEEGTRVAWGRRGLAIVC